MSRSSRILLLSVLALAVVLTAAPVASAQTSEAPATPSVPKPPATPQQTFPTPEAAADALIAAATVFDVEALKKILGSEGLDLVVTADTVQDENAAKAFAEQAQIRRSVVIDSTNPKIATLNVGAEDWPTPVPMVRTPSGQWRFDTKAGRVEVLRRRIGRNELDAIQVCRGYVEAQQEYAFERRDGKVNQYAQRIISTPGKKDGLVWKTADGTWEGPIAEPIATAIAEGYSSRFEPYHGYYFKVLKGQGPAAQLGRIDFVVNGAMIGGFALAAAPAEYGNTGVMTFIVSHDGVVFEKDLGPTTLETFKSMTLFNPDKTWKPVEEP
ncbi:MAG TPA: DUF2950 domain-containing protein [Candidatus Polarisedimenticolia bacterium]|nr:DUF2950 domain-containing protein [Candidatus Polarisedimenticolia bacterium]